MGEVLMRYSFPAVGSSESSEVANEDCGDPASLFKKIILAGSCEERLLRLSQPKSFIRVAPEPIGAKRIDDVSGRAVSGFDLKSEAPQPKSDTPSPDICFRMQITYENISVGSGDAGQFARHTG
jgi:hypothetical protein